MNDDLQQQLIKDLIVESFEGLEQYDSELLELEEGKGGSETLNNIFRVIHTIKGTAGCLGLGRIESSAHVGENLLSLLRDGELESTPEMITALLALSDALRELLQSLEETGSENSAHDHSAILEKLKELQNAPSATSAIDEPAKEEPVFGLFDEEDNQSSDNSQPVVEVASASQLETGDAPKSNVVSQSIRVDVDQLDKIMNMVGELVLTRNQVVANTEQFDSDALLIASQRLNTITTELQEGVMKTRMQPIGNIWSRLPRVVRDVANGLGKKVKLVMDGQSTELDRTVIEAIKDPLTHIIRNSIDHGIEDPDTRRESKKPEEGLLCLRAFHEGGQVNIEITDDGAGINFNRVKSKAIESGIISVDEAARMSDREATNLIFHPGLSCAQKVSNVSGRGVGMDVVKTNIEKTGGSVNVYSQSGQGTTIVITIPLTLAIIPALIITNGSDRFAIPQVSLLELLRLEGASIQTKIEVVHGTPFYRLRGQLLPLVYLNQLLDIEDPDQNELEDVNIIVLQADGRQFGLVVDQINDSEEIVVKPLNKILSDIACFAGATIMGDGKVALILDVLGLARQSQVVSETPDSSHSINSSDEDEKREDTETLLIFKINSDHRMAIPLSAAARLEEIQQDSVEKTSSQDVVQYRNEIMPLIRVSDFVSINSDKLLIQDNDAPLQVVVYSDKGNSVGLIVDQIEDIIEASTAAKRASPDPCIIGSIVVQEKVTDLLDAPAIVRLSGVSNELVES